MKIRNWTILLVPLCACGSTVEVRVTDSPRSISSRKYGTLRKAVANGAIEQAKGLATTDEERTLVAAFDSAMRGNWSRAEAHVQSLSTVDVDAKTLLALAYKHSSRWDALVDLLEGDPSVLGSSRSANLALAGGFREAEPESIAIPEDPVVVPMGRMWTGQAEVDVTIAGRSYAFVIDTGADLTVLSSDVAEACEVFAIGDWVGSAETSTSQTVQIRPAILPELNIGALVVKNHPVAIVDREVLTFRLAGIPLAEVRGILGWSLIRRLSVEIDYVQNRVVFARSTGRNDASRNLFWLGYPMVRLRGPTGESLVFGLDTGAQKTTLKRHAFEKMKLLYRVKEGVSIGAGGGESVIQREVANLLLQLGDYDLYFKDIRSKSGVKAAQIVEPDGRLGIDIARSGGLKIDYPAGRIDLMF